MVCFYLKYPVIQIGVTDTEVWSLIASLTYTETFNCAAQEKKSLLKFVFFVGIISESFVFIKPISLSKKSLPYNFLWLYWVYQKKVYKVNQA